MRHFQKTNSNVLYRQFMAVHDDAGIFVCRYFSIPTPKSHPERHSMQGARTLHGSRKHKGGSRKQKIAYCASARSGYSGASIISCVTSYFLLHASDFVRRLPDRGQGMTWKGGATPQPLPTLCTIRSRKITTAVTVAPKHTGDLNLLPQKLHNELKSPIDRIIFALWHINAPPNNQRAA